jgi:hypothetical protein
MDFYGEERSNIRGGIDFLQRLEHSLKWYEWWHHIGYAALLAVDARAIPPIGVDNPKRAR